MRKNGFVATSVLYSFFLVFISLFILLIATYVQNQNVIDRTNEKIRENLSKIDNRFYNNLLLGDHIRVSTKGNDTAKSNLNDFGIWTVGYINEEAGTKYAYLFGDDSTRIIDSSKADSIANLRTGNLDITLTGATISFEIPNLSILQEINDTADEKIKHAVFDYSSDYVVKENSDYYLMRIYRFQKEQSDKVNNYCGTEISPTDSKFIYKHNELTANNNQTGEYFVNYCLNIKNNNYTHNRSDGIVSKDEKQMTDKIVDTASTGYILGSNGVTAYKNIDTEDSILFFPIRYMMKIAINGSGSGKFIGGDGSMNDPYILSSGGNDNA